VLYLGIEVDEDLEIDVDQCLIIDTRSSIPLGRGSAKSGVLMQSSRRKQYRGEHARVSCSHFPPTLPSAGEASSALRRWGTLIALARLAFVSGRSIGIAIDGRVRLFLK